MAEGAPTVLLVEDNPNDMELALLALRDGGGVSHVDVVRDGVEALDYLFRQGTYADRPAGHEPRAVLLDIKLPLLNGIDVLQRLKTDDRTRHLPVIMLTSSAQRSDLARCYRLGVNSYIVKPVDMDTFFDTMRHIGHYWLVLNQPESL
ncbi:response regulator [Actinophytocola xanthii]|uniref:Two-component system response regulator n=1 Tax=Actinophytocola xanthii TaxID=1912961 RepID=A0A1Q8CAC7_9PSEU|nr:response regulator [Actinophytocola xanthii]OLF11331.1 two-component system response regulator [Actinophytocola xanthii]